MKITVLTYRESGAAEPDVVVGQVARALREGGHSVSILAEHGPDWFEDFQPSPYMERTLRFRPEKCDLLLNAGRRSLRLQGA